MIATNALNMDTSKIQNINTDFQAVLNTVNSVEAALKNSFNADLGSINVSKFQQELQSCGMSINTVRQHLNSAGAEGQAAFRNLTTQIMTANMQVKQTNSFLQSMGKTFVNTLAKRSSI